MTSAPNEQAHSDSFESMAEEFALLVRRGESPDINDFAKRNDELAMRVRRLFPVLEMLEQNGHSNAWSETDLLDAEQKHFELGSEKWTAPKRLGDIRLIREIGRGGMGIVYEAEQESLGRRVAIKILPTSAQFDERRVERFATEAKASALLHHTNIVPVFGVGRENGVSFFVMQYINGQPLDRVLQDVSRVREHSSKRLDETITNFPNPEIIRSLFGESVQSPTIESREQEYAAEPTLIDQLDAADVKQKLSSNPNDFRSIAGSESESSSLLQSSSADLHGNKARNYFRNVARVGVKVSEALDHAHRHGILHRDIKPSNLLLDEGGAVWVTDFGLAKHFDSPDITRPGEVVGTLRYMSPEQLDGNATSSSDIFGLGLTLYEMLTLQPAYPGIDKKRLLEKVTEANPANPRSIDSRIPRDLETVIMKCIHSEPSKRYESASEVSADLDRFLEGQPILARRIGVAEKTWKWCCRCPMLAATIAALAASIVLGVAGVGWQWSKTSDALSVSQANFEKAKKATTRAEEHFNQARSAVVQITETISQEKLLTSPDLLSMRRKLLLKALDYQIEFVKRVPGNDEVALELANAWLQLAAVANDLPKIQEAKDSLQESQTVLESLLEQELAPAMREQVVISLAETYSLAGKIAMRESPDGQNHMFEAMRILLDGHEENELSNLKLIKLAELHRTIGGAYTDQNLGRPHPIESLTQHALEHFTKSFELTSTVSKTDGANKRFAKMLAADHRDLGMANRRLGNSQKAHDHYTAAIDQFRELVEFDPENTDYRFGLAEALSSIAFYYTYTERDTEKSLGYYHESINEYQKLSNDYPSVLKFVVAESKTLMNCCILYERVGRSSEATAMRQRTLDLATKSLLFAPNDPKYLSSYGRALLGMGTNCTRLRKREQAMEHYVKAREQHEKAVAVAPLTPAYRIRLARTIIAIGGALKLRNDFDGARKKIFEAFDPNTPDADVSYLTGRALLLLAKKITANTENASQADLKVADEAIVSAKEIFEDLAGPKYQMRDRILGDKKLKAFVKSKLGTSFMEWFASIDSQLR